MDVYIPSLQTAIEFDGYFWHKNKTQKTDLQAVNPDLANEWNHKKNNGLTPADVLPSSNKKAWWKCQNGHEWQAVIGSRNQGRGCPQCAKEKRKNH